jgi:hypothetical protein
MKKSLLALLACGSALAIAPLAYAQTYDFTYVSGSNVASGQITITGAPAALGNDVISGSILYNASTLPLYQNPTPGNVSTSPLGAFNYDNVLYPLGSQGTYLDGYGLLFANPIDTEEINIWSNGTGFADSFYQYVPGVGYVQQDNTGVFSISVPEYGSLSMLILCALVVAGAFFFKGRQSGLFLNS